jgi:(2Fe-2S) ferredoxin
MPEEQTAPYICHIFVCTNDRHGERKSCAEGNSPAVLSLLKDEAKNRGWTGQVRVSQCGCMGLCMKGPNVLLYPQKIWFSGVTESDVPVILAKVDSMLEK